MSSRLLLTMFGASLVMAGCNTETGTDDTDDTDTNDTDTDDTNSQQWPENDSFEEAIELSLEEGMASFDDAIEVAGDHDFFSFEAIEGNWYVIYTPRFDAAITGEPDTVLKVYDAAQNLLAESDDLPYWMSETDSGWVFRATSSQTIYLEVMEWTDWAEMPPEGMSYWEYTLYLNEFLSFPEALTSDETGEDGNDDLATVQATLDTLDDENDENDAFSWYGDPWVSSYLFTPGAITTEGDVDLFPMRADTSPTDADGNAYAYTGEVCQFSFTHGVMDNTALNPRMRLLDAEGHVLAETTEPEYGFDYQVFYDAGITYPIFAEGGDFFVEVTDADGSFGQDHWYTVLSACYPATLREADGTNRVQIRMENSALDDEGKASNLDLLESSSDPDTKFISFAGFLDDGESDTDLYEIGEVKKYLDLEFVAGGTGSSLTDLTVEVHKGACADRSEDTLLTTLADGLDGDGGRPVLEGFDLLGQNVTSGSLCVEVTSTGASTPSDEVARPYYLGSVTLTDTAG